MDNSVEIQLQAAAFRRLMQHLLTDRPDVQNIDLMNMAGFCRNCLSRWYQEAAADQGIDLTKDQAREIVYGMPYSDWVEKHQTPASDEKLAQFSDSFSKNVGDASK